jgi:wyosine [tRNA(Phe)-imidazoG37] synthetase (radical SAM superfamily)
MDGTTGPGSPRKLDFQDHRRELQDNRYVYAVVSRRSRGLSIGLNLNPDKACTFACPYCQVDRTIPGGDRRIDLDRLEAELCRLLDLSASGEIWSHAPFSTAAPALRRVNDIALAGDGEPTACPDFAAVVERLGQILPRYSFPDLGLYLLTTGTLFHRPAVDAALQTFEAIGGEIWAKLDAGTQAWFERVDGTRLSLDRIQNNLLVPARRKPIVIQSFFCAIGTDAPGSDEAQAWAARIANLLAQGAQIREIQVTTVARKPADSSVTGLSETTLESIAAAARSLGPPVRVYPGSPAGMAAASPATTAPSSLPSPSANADAPPVAPHPHRIPEA